MGTPKAVFVFFGVLLATAAANLVGLAEYELQRVLSDKLRDVAQDMYYTNSFSRTLAGPFDQLNSVLSPLSLSLDTSSLAEDEVEVLKGRTIGPITVSLWFRFSNEAKCDSLSIQSIEIVGRHQGAKEFYPPWFDDDDKANLPGIMKDRFFLDILVNGITLKCNLGMDARNSINSQDRDVKNGTYLVNGNLLVDVRDLDLNLTTLVYSGSNFSWSPPEITENVVTEYELECPQLVIFQDLNFEVKGLQPVDLLVTKVDIDASVQEKLNGDSRYLAQVPIEDILCDLLVNATVGLGEFLVENEYANQTNPTYLRLPKGTDRIKVEKAIKLEKSFNPAPAVDLAVIGDNALVNLVGAFPEESKWISGDDPTKSIFTDLYSFVVDIDLDVNNSDPILAVVDKFLNTSLYNTSGKVVDMDLLQLAEDVLGSDTIDASAGISIEQELSFVKDAQGKDVTAIKLAVSVKQVLVSILPRKDATKYQRNWIDRIYLLGNQTIRVPTIEGFDIVVKVALDFDVDFFGGSTLIGPDADPNDALTKILVQIGTLTLREKLVIDATWHDFFFETAANIAVDQNAVKDLRVGSLPDNLLDCLVSTFYITPRFTDAVLNHQGFDLAISGAVDGITVVLQTLVNDVLPLYQGLLPGVAEVLLNDEFVNKELIEPTNCPRPVDTGALFSFEGKLMDTIQEYLNPDLLQTLLDLAFPKGEGKSKDWNQIVKDPVELLNFAGLPSTGGRNITLEIILEKIEISGVSPGNYTNFRLLEVNKNHPFYPNGLFNELGVGIESNPVKLGVEFRLNSKPENAFIDSRRLSTVGSEDPIHYFEESDENTWPLDDDDLPDFRLLQTVDEFSDVRQLQTAPVPQPTEQSEKPTFSPTTFPTRSPTFPRPTLSPSTPYPTHSPVTPAPVPLPPGAQQNHFRLNISFDNIYALLDLLLKFYQYDVENTRLENVLEVWCWLGKLLPYSGPKEVVAKIQRGELDFECIQCMNDVLKGLEERFSNPKASEEFFKLVNQVLEYAAQILEDFFIEDNWNTTVTDIQRWCVGLDTLPNEKEFDIVKEDLGSAYAFLFMGTSAVILSGIVNCFCIKGTHDTNHPEPLVGSEDKKVADLAFLEQVDDNNHVAYEMEHTTLFNHPVVPVFWRIAIPLLLSCNLILFVIGHVGVAVTTTLLAGVAGFAIELEDFQSISVLQSAEALWNSGGYALAILIIVLSITWPYVKILGMTIAWFTPTRFLSFHKRGLLIKRLDQLGKWSLVELYLLLFVLVTFRLQVSSPNLVYLPEGLYKLSLLINPQVSIYTFCTALVVSLLTSNFIEWFHEKAEKKLATANREPQKTDDMHISLLEFLFPTKDNLFSVGITKLGTALLTLFIILSIMMVVVAAATPVLGTEIIGLAKLIIEIEEKETVQTYSLFRFLTIIFGSGSSGEVYLAVFFLLTVMVIPVVQLLVLLRMLLGRFTLDRAIFIYDVNVMLSSWCCSEVFALGVAFTVMELGQISGSLVREECSFLQPFMENQLLALNLVDNRDVQASCFTLLGSVQAGLYVLFGAVILSNIAHYFITVAFMKFIQARLDIRENRAKHGLAVTGLEKVLLVGRCMFKSDPDSEISV